MYLHRASCHSSATLTEIFPCFFLSCKANARVNPAKMGHGPHSSSFCVVLSIFCFVSFCVFFVCECVLYYSHRLATQLQLTIISYNIIVTSEEVTTAIHFETPVIYYQTARHHIQLRHSLKETPRFYTECLKVTKLSSLTK